MGWDRRSRSPEAIFWTTIGLPGDANTSNPSDLGAARTPFLGGGATVADIETAVGVTGGSVGNINAAALTLATASAQGAAFTGSGFYQEFTASVGDKILFDFAFDLDTNLHDFAFAVLVDQATGQYVAPTASADSVVNNNLLELNPGVIGPPPVTPGGLWQVTSSGTYRVGFFIVNTVTDDSTSNLYIDTVQVQVPEINVSAATLPLAILAIVFLGLFDSRRRVQSSAVEV